MTSCFFVSDLHGSIDRYTGLFQAIAAEKPKIVFIGGDIMPGLAMVKSLDFGHRDFLGGYLQPELMKLRAKLGDGYPEIYMILGNDDGKYLELTVLSIASEKLWRYIQGSRVRYDDFSIYGYAYSPPSPFQLKDWERYDVSRYADPGCVSPEEGSRTVPAAENEARFSTIKSDLSQLVKDEDLSQSIFLFHSPPYKTKLDRAALDNKMVDYVPQDVHVGSIAIRQFIETRQPMLTLHGHVHESAEITGSWRDKIGNTLMFTAAHRGAELALVRFDLEKPENASRELI